MPTIVSQIEIAEQELLSCESRLDKIERKIRISDLTDIQLKALEKEEKELQKEKKKHETTISQLRKENGKNTFISFVILGLILIIYYTFWSS
ncbi:coiled-coil domain-containing protein 167-like [Ruditapes philippinarum]|uniref:coiled-coil domain-containing protein 167-like n=1 Tax=Ruditapes philippinarum TaxID=129788 RepID=UPI00295BBD04|nr:coiled-coil domain-containing protein 167-like [Ruditapes philippinarum]